jgi:hypothetical protein
MAWPRNGNLRSARPDSPSQRSAIACSIIECRGACEPDSPTCRPCRREKLGGGCGNNGPSDTKGRKSSNGRMSLERRNSAKQEPRISYLEQVDCNSKSAATPSSERHTLHASQLLRVGQCTA